MVVQVIEVRNQLLVILHVDNVFTLLELPQFILVALQLLPHFFVHPFQRFNLFRVRLRGLLGVFELVSVDLPLQLLELGMQFGVERWV